MAHKILMSMLAVTAFLVGGLIVTPQAQAADCEVAIDATDAMTFSTKTIEVKKSCKEFTIKLTHTGKLAKNIMGHNVVVVKATDQAAVLEDGSAAGLDNNYLKPSDARVIASTKVIGGGESATTKFATSKLDAKESYVFFCAFPGHAMMMKGVVKVI
ncbi:MAG: azurin [Methylophilaceae bacterium]|nr:azurin [Methyloradius sp.]